MYVNVDTYMQYVSINTDLLFMNDLLKDLYDSYPREEGTYNVRCAVQ